MKTHRNQSQSRARKAAPARVEVAPADLGLRFRILNEHAPLAIGVSRRGIGVYANPRLVQMFGLRSVGEWIGRPVSKFFAPQSRGESRDRTRRRNRGLSVRAEFESIGLRADGSQFPIHVAVARAQLADGPTNIAFITDITGRQQAEAALAASEVRFRTLIEQAPLAISISRNGSGVYANWKLAQLFGLRDGAAWIGRPMLEWFAPQVREEAQERMRRQSLGLQVELEFESVAQRPDGSQFPVHVAITVVTLADGPANVAFITDITERKRAEQVLTENEVKLRALFEGSGYSMGLAKNGIHIMVNPAYAELFGYAEAAEVIGKSLFDDIAPEERPRLREFALRRARGESVSPAYETRGIRRDGTIFDMAVRVSTYELGGEVYSIGILRDISEQKRAEEALHASEEQLRALAARIEQVREEERAGLARELHDELGQGLTALQIDLAWLDGRLRTARPGEFPALRDKIAGMVPRAERLIESTQAISASMRPGVLDDLGLVAAVEWLAADFAQRTGLACATKLPAADLTLELDLSVAMFRIVQEALTNVIRHARASRVEVRLDVGDGDLVVEIEDNGGGITPQQVAARRSLGIFGMRERAAAFGGGVEFRSPAGGGTTVRVRVPCRPGGGKDGPP